MPRVSHITIDVETFYPEKFVVGRDLYSQDGFLIGAITDSVVSHEE